MNDFQSQRQIDVCLKELAQRRQRWVDANIENSFDKGIKTLLTQLYPENAHFIFELLQNAEDKGAREVIFRLHSDRLVVEHDGEQLFSFDNIENITSIGNSPKQNDETKIGKFGVGFKSVFAYTDTPEIHSGHFHVRIRDLVVPSTEGVVPTKFENTTRFVLPFNNSSKPPDQAVREIETGLLELAEHTLLFLTHIHTVSYHLVDGANGSVQRVTHPEGRIEIRTHRPGNASVDQSFWLRFDKSVSVVDEEDANQAKKCPIAIAYKLESRDKSAKEFASAEGKQRLEKWKIVPVESGSVSIYFPAAKEDSRLRFCLHAPFASTVARDSVRECPANDILRDHLARLVADSLISIRNSELLTIDFLGVLPLAADGLSSFYEPILNSIVDVFRKRAITPTLSGKFRRAKSLCKGSHDLTMLLSDSDLAHLSKKQFLRWVDTPHQKNQREDKFLSSIGINEWTAKDLREAASNEVHEVAAKWLQGKDDNWMTALYCRLNKLPEYSEARNAATAYPIVRLVDGTHIHATVNEQPAAYLPSNSASSVRFKTISPAVLKEPDARDYFLSLNYSEPNVVAELIDHILPLYSSKPLPTAKENVRHVMLIAESCSTDSITVANRNRLIAILKKTAFVRCKELESGQGGYAKPAEVYELSDDLRLYFGNHASIKVISPSYSKEAIGVLRELGVVSCPRPVPVDYGNPKMLHECTYECGIENYELEGLKCLLLRIGIETDTDVRSAFAVCICRLLTTLLEKNPKCFQAKRHYFRYTGRTQEYESLFVQQLKEAAWLVATDGRLLRPPNASRDELPEEVLQFDDLLVKLGVQPSTAAERAQQQQLAIVYASKLGINPEQAEFVRQHKDEFEEWRSSVEKKAANRDAIANAVSRTSERRRQKLKERNKVASSRESALKMRSVPAYSSAEIDLHSLLGFYRNDDEKLICQICLECMPFVKRDGDEYFECVTLLTKSWADERQITLKVTTPPNLILCPVCSCFYREYVHKDLGLQNELYEAVMRGADYKVTIGCSRVNGHEQDRVLHFNPTHLSDIRECLEQADQ